MQFENKMHPRKMGFHDYIEALEEERKKIQVFTRELPLSLELVTQAIEACKQQMSGTMAEYNLNGQSECSEQTSMDEGLVFEEFIPLKKKTSNDCEEDHDDNNDHDDEQNSSHKKMKNSGDKKKSDWLRSVQLWNPNPPTQNEEVGRKTSVVELNRNGGAFQPFHKEEISVGMGNESATGKATTSAAAVVATRSSTSSKKEEKRKQRRCWSQELHKRFLHALQQLSGADSATPKQIREQMNVDGLTNDEVKSHLQKFRLHTRRSPIMHNNANLQTAPLFLVGNIFVQPQEYATLATTTTTTVSSELTTVTTQPGIYAPVATHPTTVMKQRLFKQHSHSEERANHSEGVVLSNSPASSSSTHTPTASPAS